MLCVTGYGLGLTLMTQTTRLKLDRVQNEPMRVILGTIKDTLTETTKFMLASHQCKSRQKAEHVKSILRCCRAVLFGEMVISDWILEGPFGLAKLQSFESVLSFCPFELSNTCRSLIHAIVYTACYRCFQQCRFHSPLIKDRQHGFTVCEGCLIIPTQGRQPRDVAHTDRQTCLTAHAARVGARPEIWVKACDLQQGSSRDALRVARVDEVVGCLLYTSPSPRDASKSRMPSSA